MKGITLKELNSFELSGNESVLVKECKNFNYEIWVECFHSMGGRHLSLDFVKNFENGDFEILATCHKVVDRIVRGSCETFAKFTKADFKDFISFKKESMGA